MNISRSDFEKIAQHINESRALGLFADGNAATIFTREFIHIIEGIEPRFDGQLFEEMSGVPQSNIIFEDRTDEHLDDREILVDCE